MNGRHRPGRALFVLPVLATLLGLVAAGTIWAREVSQARQRDLRAATQVATAFAQSAAIDVDGLRGASGLVADDGVVSTAELEAFADDLLGDSAIRVVALATVVPAAERAAFEAEHGRPISDIGADGSIAPAAGRPSYLPVVAAAALDDSVTPSIGIDISSDPRRAAAVAQATQQRAPSVSPPIVLVPSGRTGYLTVLALRTPDDRVVGYLTAVFGIDQVVDAALASLDRPTDVALFDRGERISGTLDGGASARVVIGGRTIDVRADERTPATAWPAIVVAIGALLAGAALAVSMHQLRRSERAASTLAGNLDHDREQALQLADLGRQLTAARTRGDVIRLVAAGVADAVGADHADVAFVEGPLLRTADGDVPVDGLFAVRHRLAPLDAHLPTTDAVRTAVLVTVDDLERYEQAHPDLLADVKAGGIRSAAAVPLLDATGRPFGVIGMSWAAPRSFTASDRVHFSTLGALVAGTMQRVDAVQLEGERSEELAAFAQRLAVAATADDVRAVLADGGTALLGAATTDCVEIRPSGVLEGAPAIDDGVDGALARAIRDDETVTETDADGAVARAAVPLRRGADIIGAMRVTWTEPTALDPRVRATLQTVAELTGQALGRARATDDSVRHADGLARLAEQLAVATTLDQIAAASASFLPTISDAAEVHLALDGDPSGAGERHPLRDTSGDTVGELVVRWPRESGPDAAQRRRLRAAVGLVDETVRRVDIQRSTSQTLLSLRQRLLRPLPSPRSLDLAARYRPTSRPLGMGGDWYDVVERRDGSVAIVIGDVVGHGIPAIATMIHVSTILGGLVRSHTEPADIIGLATAMLDGDGMVATAQVLVLEPSESRLTMVSAGHPPPLLRAPDGSVQRLPEATHPPLGVGDGSRGRVVRVRFTPGSAVLGYTDGLVERRDQPIDAGIRRLADVFATTNGSVWGTVGSVLAAMSPDGGDRGDDDVAIVVAQHRADAD